MAATLAVSPVVPEASPPSVHVVVDAGVGSYVSSVSLTRDGGPVVGAAATGFQTALYDDYTPPYGSSCTYRAVGTTSAPSYGLLWAEAWASLSGWSQSTPGAWTVSAGRATYTGNGQGIYLSRLAVGLRKLTVGQVLISGGYLVLTLLSATSILAQIEIDEGAVAYLGANAPLTLDSAGFTLTLDDDSIHLSSGSAQISASRAAGAVRMISLDAYMDNGTVSVGGISAYDLSGTAVTTFDVSESVTLDSDRAYLINPKNPALSVQVGVGPQTDAVLHIGRTGLGDVTRESQATRQRAAGATEDAIFRIGQRAAPSFTLTGYTLDADAHTQLIAALADEVPVFFRFPASWAFPMEERWWAVGDIAVSFVNARQDKRQVALPLTPAAQPSVVVSPLWSEGALMIAFATEADVVAAFATEYDKVINNRR